MWERREIECVIISSPLVVAFSLRPRLDRRIGVTEGGSTTFGLQAGTLPSWFGGCTKMAVYSKILFSTISLVRFQGDFASLLGATLALRCGWSCREAARPFEASDKCSEMNQST